MKDFVILTDATCDLPEEYAKKEDIKIINMSYTIDLKTYDGSEGNKLDSHDFYKKMRAGSMATTALVNPLTAKEAAEKYLKEGKDVLYIAFSSALSGSCESAKIAAKELNQIYDNKVKVIDSLCASLGEGLLIHYAAQYKKAGHTFEETAKYTEDLKQRICHYFTVNDLFHLYRGGRVSKSKALVGTLLNIKPLLYTNAEGKLIPLKNTMGRKKSLMGLVACMENKVKNTKNDIVFISHGDCLDDAKFVAEKVKEKFGINNFLIGTIGAVVGSHSGPDTVALFFLGENRNI